jgi:prevent-host-death family protein
VTATETKAKLLSLLNDVARGDEIEITGRGRVVGRLVPASGPHILKGSLHSVAMTAGGDDDPLRTDATWNLLWPPSFSTPTSSIDGRPSHSG